MEWIVSGIVLMGLVSVLWWHQRRIRREQDLLLRSIFEHPGETADQICQRLHGLLSPARIEARLCELFSAERLKLVDPRALGLTQHLSAREWTYELRGNDQQMARALLRGYKLLHRD